MSESINLNSFPYFDDFEESKNYKKVLFKPGTSIQARELTTIQSSLQNQIESFSNTAFFDGQVIEGGSLNYISNLDYIILEDNFNGIPVSSFIDKLNGLVLLGSLTGVKAKVVSVLTPEQSDVNKNTLYLKYLTSNSTDFSENTFRDSEELVVLETLNIGTTIFFQNTSVVRSIANNSTGTGSAVKIEEGKNYVRGYFTSFAEKLLILDQYSSNPTFKVGFEVNETLITSLEDSSLNDNARGFSNFAAPGADRLKISTDLVKKLVTDLDTDSFIEILRIEDGKVKSKSPDRSYKFIEDELARRTYDESGDYIVEDFEIQVDETLNDLKTSNGLYLDTEITYKNNEPSEDLVSISISPGKAYVRGYEIEKISNTIIEVDKARDSKLLKNQTIPVNFGKTIIVNNFQGEIETGITTYYAELRNQRKGEDQFAGTGDVIGNCRIYDAKLRETYDNATSEMDVYLYDMQFLSELVVSSDIVSYETGAIIEGKNSGATGLIRGSDGLNTNPAGVSTFTVYRTSGNFQPNEPYYIDGVLDSRIIQTVTNHGFDEAKSIRMVGSGTTFAADLLLSKETALGSFDGYFRVAPVAAGIVTITSPENRFTGVKVNDIVKFNGAGTDPDPIFNRVTEISSTQNFITAVGITTIPGICEGRAIGSGVFRTGVTIISPELLSSGDPGLFASIPNELVSDVDITDSRLRIRKEYVVNVAGNSATINEGSTDLAFVGFGVDKYILIYSDGSVEPLTSQQIAISGSSRQLDLLSLSQASDIGAKLIATLSKRNLTTTNKSIKSGATYITHSTNNLSGSVKNTLFDGLTFDSQGKYGTRVQDKEISLHFADCIRVNAIFESNNLSTPLTPTVTVSNNTSTLAETISGEEIVGATSNAVAKVLPNLTSQTNTSTKVNFVYLNSNRFNIGEKITFKSSGITATVSSLTFGSKDVTANFEFDNGQRNDYYDYSRIIRTKKGYVPTRSLLVIFDRYDLKDGSNDFANVDSYELVSYENDIITFNGTRNTDILDFRPRMAQYTVAGSTYGPFHFLNRSFTGNSSSVTVIDDESIELDYSFYLPRIDKISLSKEGKFDYKKGIPSVNPQIPAVDTSSIDLFTLYYPAYTFDSEDVVIDVTTHKRYTMKDLRKMESRVENLERFTTLSLLEAEVNSLKVIDDETGLDKFKTGFIVDGFNDETSQNTATPYNNVAVDSQIGELRPSTYTTSLDLVWGSKSYIGITQNADPTADLSTATDLESNNLKKTGNLVTLDYSAVEFLDQPYANGSVRVNGTNIANFTGNISLYPSSDTWFDSTNYKKISNSTEDPYFYNKNLYSGVENSNFYENRFYSWKDFWTGRSKIEEQKNYNGKIDPYFWKKSENTQYTNNTNNIQSITLNSQINTQNSKSVEKKIFNKEVIPYSRRRNFTFVCDSLKPSTRFYPFLDKVSLSGFIIPKFIEITMISGSFSVGEKISGYVSAESSTQSNARFCCRAASGNHKSGTYNSPSEVYLNNPYNSSTLQSTYSQTSSVLNIDLNSLSSLMVPEYYGYVVEGMTLIGNTSGAKATVKTVRLVSDVSGSLQGAFYIPSYHESSKVFLTGRKTLKITSDKFNEEYSALSGISFAEKVFSIAGDIPLYQNDIVSTRSTGYEKLFDRANTASGGNVLNVFENNTFANNLLVNNGYANPLAQLFAVEQPTGIFVTSIDLFFESKDDTLPVTLDIRSVRDKLPTSVSIPLSKKTIYPTGITTSANSTTATTFEFESPVFLEGGRVYSLMVTTDSDQYRLYNAQFNNNTVDLNTGESVNRVSSVGELYVPGNINNVRNDLSNLKFKVNKAKFTQNSGALSLYNPTLDFGNNQRPTLTPNPLVVKSNKQLMQLTSPITSVGIATLGLQISQTNNLNSTGFIVNTLGEVGLGTTGLVLSQVGTGLTPTAGIQTYSAVTFTSLTGRGSGVAATVTVNSGSISTISVYDGGQDYAKHDVLTATIGNTGINYQFSVGVKTDVTSFVVDDIQGRFNSSGNLVIRNVSTGQTTAFSQNIIPDTITQFEDDEDGLHFLVNHKNHGMYSKINRVTINDIGSSYDPTTLSDAIDADDTTINLTSGTDFGTFENVSVATTNPGYIQIGSELISYTAESSGTLTGVTRGVDGTQAVSHTSGDYVYKYENNFISLRRLNTEFDLNDATTVKSNTGNQYYLKVGIDTNGTDRSASGNFPELFFKESKDLGGSKVNSTQNIVYNSITPNVQTFIPTSCSVNSSVRTITGTSEDGLELSYSDNGFEEVTLNQTTEFDTVRMIATRANELLNLSTLPGSKSFVLRLNLSTNDENLSPVVDLDRAAVILSSNNINNPISNYKTDSRVNTLDQDPNESVYISKTVDLQINSSGLKVIFDAYKPEGTDIRVLYKLIDSDSDNSKFVLFPGYNNLDLFGNVVNTKDNDGTEDNFVNFSKDGEYKQHEYTLKNANTFSSYAIKIIMTTTNSSVVPKLRNLRAISLS